VGLLGLLGVVALLGCGGDAEGPAGGAPGGGGRPPSRVAVGVVESGPLAVRHRLTGRTAAEQEATLAAGANGAVGRVRVRVGDVVQAGDLLFDVDPSVARADLAAARATAATAAEEEAQAGRDAERFRGAGPEAVAATQIEQAESRAEQLARRRAELSARVRQTRSRLAQQIVRAPFAGQVVQRLADPGDWVSAGTPVLQLVSMDRVEVHAAVDPVLLARLSEGQEATLRFGGEALPARVAGVVRVIDSATGTAPLRLVPATEERPAWLLPGRFLDVEIELPEDGGVVVPRDAVAYGVRGARVVRVVDGAARVVPVQVLVQSGERALVVGEGLAVGQQVVTRGNERLRPDEAVVVDGAEAAAPGAAGAASGMSAGAGAGGGT
jgi:RND family efflux transporter MFP subunit